jgi:putative transcriptional regulator
MQAMQNSIKVERAKKNITQAKLAELAKVSRQTINAMELGKYVPSTILALRMAAIFEVEVSEIFTLEDGDWE